MGRLPAFAEQLRCYRLRAGFSQEALAEQAGVTVAAISSLERSVRLRPYPRTVRALADALALSDAERGAFIQAVPATAHMRRPALTAAPGRVEAGSMTSQTTLIGRGDETASLVKLVSEGQDRLFTLIGVGGCGKTRLARALAGEVAGTFAHVWWVDLAPLADPALITQAIAAVLDEHGPGLAPVSNIIARLRAERQLLILDNCEHLIQASAGIVETLLAQCPLLRIVTTSREPLQTTGERVIPVAPLAIPSLDGPISPDVAGRSPAVELFVSRALAQAPGFQLTAENALTVAQICVQLEGIPLALELAAARVRVLPVAQILERLDNVFGLLVNGRRTAAARQQTLRSALDWSYDLLSEAEQALLRRLAVLAGGFDLEAAAACAGQATAQALDLLSCLVDKSLAVAMLDANTARYRLLEPVRQYARLKLDAAAETPAAQMAHAAYFVTLAERASAELDGPAQTAWSQRLALEQDNLRAALRWSYDCGDSRTALRLASALVPFWELGGHMSEGYHWLPALLAMPASSPPEARAKALLGAGRMANWQADRARALEYCQESLELYRELQDERGVAESLLWLSVATRDVGDIAGARPLCTESLAIFQKLSNDGGTAEALRNLSILDRLEGDSRGAIAMGEESLALFELVGDPRHIARGYTQLGLSVLELGDMAVATDLLIEGLRGHCRVRDRWFMAYALVGLASVYASGDNPVRAARLLGTAFASHESLGLKLSPASSRSYELQLARLQARLGDEGFASAWSSGYPLAPDDMISELASLGSSRPAHAARKAAAAAAGLSHPANQN